MEIKDVLPLFGIFIGWILAEGSSYGKRKIERKKALGRSISIFYFLFREIAQLKGAQEFIKNSIKDIDEWERGRQRSFQRYTNNDPGFMTKLNETADIIGEYYPIEGFELREILKHYQLIKINKLDAFKSDEETYIKTLSEYDSSLMGLNYKLQQIIFFLARKQSIFLWIRLKKDFHRMLKAVPENDIIYLQQVIDK